MDDSAIKNLWDDRAGRYAASANNSFRQSFKLRILEKYARSDSVCLDIGAATGLFSIPLAPQVKEIHAIDLSPEMVAQCRVNAEKAGVNNLFVYERSATAPGFEDASFDLIFSFATLAVVPQVEQAYAEIARLLKPGGIAVLDITGRHNLSRRRWERFYRKQGHFGMNYYRLDEIRAIFSALGLHVLENHCTGLLDQWKYIPGIHKLKFLDRILHAPQPTPDLDYRVSQKFPRLANHWYFVLQKLPPSQNLRATA